MIIEYYYIIIMPTDIKSVIGLSVTDAYIGLVEIESDAGKYRIIAQGEKVLEAGVIKRGRIMNEKSFRASLQEVFSSAAVNDLKNAAVSFCLGSDQIFYHVFNTMVFDKTVVEFMIKEEFLKNIPHNNERLGFVYRIIHGNEEQKNKTGSRTTEKAIVAGYKKDIKAEWELFFKNQNINLGGFEFDAYAIFEGLERDKEEPAMAIIDMRDSLANIFFFVKNIVMYSFTFYGDILAQGRNEFLDEFKSSAAVFEDANLVKLQKCYVCGDREKVKVFLNLIKRTAIGIEFEAARAKADYPTDIRYIGCLGAALRCLKDTHNDGFFLRPEAYISKECLISEKEENHSRRFLCFLEKTLYRAKNFLAQRKKLIIQLALSSLVVIVAPFIIFLIFQLGKQPGKKIDPAASAVNTAKNQAAATTTEIVSVKTVKIKAIGSALNIRSGAGKTFGVIGKAEPGGEYSLVEENGEWLKIGFGEGKEGWILGAYAEVINED